MHLILQLEKVMLEIKRCSVENMQEQITNQESVSKCF